LLARDLAGLGFPDTGDMTRDELLSDGDRSLVRALTSLAPAPARLACVDVLGAQARAGDCWQASVQRELALCICAPGRPQAPEAQAAATPLWVEIVHGKGASGRAPALAPTLRDLRITAGSALAYRVARREFI
jgi:hypothetical protein